MSNTPPPPPISISAYIASRAQADTPASTEDLVLILQGGVAKVISANKLAKVALLTSETEPPSNDLGGPGDYCFCPIAPYNLYGPKGVDDIWDPDNKRSLEGPQGLPGNPYKAYATLAAANDDLANIPAGSLIWVNADPTPANIGYWAKTGGVLVQSTNDRVALLEQILPHLAPIGYSLAIMDNNGQACIGILLDGTFKAAAANISALQVGTLTLSGSFTAAIATLAASIIAGDIPPGYAYAWLDAKGAAAAGIMTDGTFNANALKTQSINGIAARSFRPGAGAGNYTAEINHIICYGQSLSLGIGSTALTVGQRFNSLKFVDTNYNAFTPLIEPGIDGAVGVETPDSGTAESIIELIQAENLIKYTDHFYKILCSNPGLGSQTIAALSKGTAPYTKLLAQVSGGHTTAAAAGLSYIMQALTWAQGEADTSAGTLYATYKAALKQLRSDIDADVKAVSGQTQNVPLITYQVASHKHYGVAYPQIALAQLDAAIEDANIHACCPMYIFEYNTDFVHLPGWSYKWLGAYYGLVYKRVVIDGLTWDVVRPLSFTVRGSAIYIKFHVPAPPLKWDVQQVLQNDGYGFNLFDGAGNPVTLTGLPAIIANDTVKIIASAPVVAGMKLQYAFYGTGTTGRLDGPRGNLRDSQGDNLVFDGGGLMKRMDNWCFMFEHIF